MSWSQLHLSETLKVCISETQFCSLHAANNCGQIASVSSWAVQEIIHIITYVILASYLLDCHCHDSIIVSVKLTVFLVLVLSGKKAHFSVSKLMLCLLQCEWIRFVRQFKYFGEENVTIMEKVCELLYNIYIFEFELDIN